VKKARFFVVADSPSPALPSTSKVLQIGSTGKKNPVPFSIRLSPEVYVGTLTVSRLGVQNKKFQEKAK